MEGDFSEPGDYGLERYLEEEVVAKGGTVVIETGRDRTIVKATLPFRKLYVALSGGRLREGKEILYDKDKSPAEVLYFELSDVLTTHFFEVKFGRITSEISVLNSSDFANTRLFASLFSPLNSSSIVAGIAYVWSGNRQALVPLDLKVRHDRANLLTVKPMERTAGFYHLAQTGKTDFPFLKMPVVIDGVTYSIDFAVDENTFEVTQDRGDAGQVKVGGLLAIPQNVYERLKSDFMSENVWSRDLKGIAPLRYSMLLPPQQR